MELKFDSWIIFGSLIIGIVAVFWDLKYRKIPNWLTFPALILGIVLNLTLNSKAWYFSFLGILFGFLLLLIPFLGGGIGAGDVKLLMAFGAFLGGRTVIRIGIYGGIAGGLISLLILVRHYGVYNTQHRLWLLFASIWNKENRKILQPQDQTTKLYIPYGLAIFIGLVVSLIGGSNWE